MVGPRESLAPQPSADREVSAASAAVVSETGTLSAEARAGTGALEVRILGPAPERVSLILDWEQQSRPYGEGLLVFEGLSPGPHTVGLIWPERGLASPRRVEAVLIKEGETSELSLRYPELASISGRLLDPSGRPLGGGALVLRGLYIPVGPEGRFRCSAVPVGRSRLWLYHPEYGAVEAEALLLRPDEDAMIEPRFPAQGRAAIVGELRRGGLLAADAALVLKRVDGERARVVRAARSDDRGRFALRHLAPGAYLLEVDGEAVRRLGLGEREEARLELFLGAR